MKGNNFSNCCPVGRIAVGIRGWLRRLIDYHRPSHIRKVVGKRPTRCPVAKMLFLFVSVLSTLRAATITGVVVDGSTGRPLGSAHIEIKPLGLGTISQEDGGFVLEGIPEGTWEMICTYLGYYQYRKNLVVSKENNDLLSLPPIVLSPQSITLKEIVTTATRTRKMLKEVPVATEIIPREEFVRRGAVTAADALATELGFQVQEDFSGQGVSLQGVDPDKVLVLIDGNRVIGRVKGSIDLDQIPLTNVKQVEVVKGAVSTMYGSEAIGGVINLITADHSPGWSLKGDVKIGQNISSPSSNPVGLKGSLWSPGFQVGYGGASWGVQGGLRFYHQPLNDLDPTTPHTEGIEESSRWNSDVKISKDINPYWKATLVFRDMREDKEWIEDAGLVSVAVSYDDRERNIRRDRVFELTYQPSGLFSSNIKVYQSHNSHRWEKWTQARWGSPQIKDFTSNEERYQELSLTGLISFHRDHSLNWGGEVYRWTIDADARLGGISSPFQGDLTAFSLFAQNEWKIGEGWTVLPGVRLEHHEVYGVNITPRVSAMWSPTERFKARLSLGSGYRAPSSKELYFTFNHAAAGYIVYGNSHLKPERSSNISATFEYNYRNASHSRLTLYHNQMRDLIDFQPIGVSEEYYTGIFQYQNIYSARIRGLEIERTWIVFPGLEAKLGYGLMETRNDETGRPLLRRPKHSLIWDLGYSRPRTTVKVWGRWVDKAMFTDIFNTDAQATDEWTLPYQLWNLAITQTLSPDLRLTLQADNLFNATHPRYGPRQGRLVSLTLRWSLRL